MPAISFSRMDFVLKIEAGTKDQTIRPLGKRKYKRGDWLFLYYKQRTPQRKFIGQGHVKSVQVMQWKEILAIEPHLREKFAKRDGFDSWAEMITFFAKTHDPKPEDYFQVIRWFL